MFHLPSFVTVHICHRLFFLFKILRGDIQVFTAMKMRFVQGQWPLYNVPNTHFKRLIFLRTHQTWFCAHELHRFSQKTQQSTTLFFSLFEVSYTNLFIKKLDCPPSSSLISIFIVCNHVISIWSNLDKW